MPNTHCLTSGSLGTGETPVPEFPGSSTILTPAGSKRGVVVLMHGLNTGPTFPVPLTNIALPTLNYLTLAQNLQTDGWVVIWPQNPADNYVTNQNAGVFNDINNDAGNGSRYLATTEHWIDHANNYLGINYATFPVVPVGISWGGLLALEWAINKTSGIAAYCGHVPATLAWAVNAPTSLNHAPQLSFTLKSSMNGLTLPQATVTVNETISVQNPPTAGCLVVAATNVVSIPQIIRYTGWSGSNFTGCTGGDGAATMATNGSVTQSSFTSGLDISLTGLNALGNGQQGTVPVGYLGWETGDDTVGFVNTLALFNNANGASAPVTGQARTGGTHQLDATDITNITNWFTATVDPLCPKVH